MDAKDVTHAYIFYHIPEIDDPYLVTLKEDQEPVKTRYVSRDKGLISGSYVYSSWFVKSGVREGWNKAVLSPRVKGLFAGHFHDHKRDTYRGFKWLRSTDYLHESLMKLHVCPPLAIRL